jgi:hypothetical protein
MIFEIETDEQPAAVASTNAITTPRSLVLSPGVARVTLTGSRVGLSRRHSLPASRLDMRR